MKQTQKILMGQFVSIVLMVLALVVLFETDIIVSGGLNGDSQTEFLLTAVMELVTLGCAFLSLRLFRFKSIHADLVSRKAPALKKWGVARLLLIHVPIVLDTLLYYLYMKPTFGYLAIILALCLPFVWPSMNRCVAETTEEQE